MTDQQIENMANKIGEVAPHLVAVFLRNPEGFDYSLLEGESDFTDKYRNLSEFIGDKNKLLSDLYSSQDGKTPSSARIASFREKHPDISEEDIKNWFEKTNKYKAMYEGEAKAEGARNKRGQEVKDWSTLKSLITSDYEKQRYIDTPEQALFGKDAPEIGEAKNTRWGSIGDLAAGVTAGAVDLLPSKFLVLAGPLIRAARDEAHVLSDSPYSKSQGKIWGTAAADAAANLLTLGLANYRRANRVASNLANPAAAVEMERQNIRRGIELMDKMPTATRNNMHALINSMPSSPLKTALTKDMAGSTFDKSNKWKDDILRTQNSFDAVSSPEIIKRTRDMASLGKSMKTEGLTKEAMDYLDNASKYRSPTNIDKAEALVGRVLNAAKGNLGYTTSQAGRNLTGINVNSFVQPDSSDLSKKEYENRIDSVINEYSDLWSKKYKPEGYDIPLIKAAYDKWKKILGGSR